MQMHLKQFVVLCAEDSMKKLKKLLRRIGPGFITGAADDDPAGIGTYSQSGAQFGYRELWTAPFSLPFMIAVQEMCGRIGLVTGKGLAGVMKHHYPKWILYVCVFLLVLANTINIGADLGAMAASAKLIVDVPFYLLLIGFTALVIALEVFVSYEKYASYLKFLTFSLFAYVITVFLVRQDWSEIFFSTISPTFSLNNQVVMNIVAILGTTISPYLFFWQASEEVEEEVEHGRLKMMGKGIPRVFKKDIRDLRIDTVFGMFFSNIVMFFIMVTSASTLHQNGITSITTADQAARALRPLAGDYAFFLFALGILGTGLLAIPVLAGASSYAISEVFGWKEGLYQKFHSARKFYGVIISATLVGFIVNLTPIEPFQMLYYSAVINGMIAPVLLILILFVANNRKIMGSHTNSLTSNVLGITITIFMLAASLILLPFLLSNL